MRQPFVFIGNAPSFRHPRDPGSAFNKMCHNNLISFTATKPRAFSFISPAFFEKECVRMWFVFCLFVFFRLQLGLSRRQATESEHMMYNNCFFIV